jgi:hypothetical protein
MQHVYIAVRLVGLFVLLAACPAHACDVNTSFMIELMSGKSALGNCQTGQMTLYDFVNEALQVAIDSLPGDGFILIRAGISPLAGGVELRDNITIVGETNAAGAPTTRLNLVGNPGGNTIRNFRPSLAHDDPRFHTGRQGMTLKNLVIDASGLAEYIVVFNRSIDTVVKNVKVLNPTGSAFGSSGCVNLLFADCEAQAMVPAFPGGHGFSIGGAPDGVRDVGT